MIASAIGLGLLLYVGLRVIDVWYLKWQEADEQQQRSAEDDLEIVREDF